MSYLPHERAALDAALSRLNLSLTSEQCELLLSHLHLLSKKNKEINLTRVEDIDEAIVLHVEDSLSILPEFNSFPGTFCDIGTGGGFPGIPLGIASGRSGILLDSVQKKARAVQEFIEELGLSDQLNALGMRSEELAVSGSYSFDVVVARAVSSLNVVEELSTPLLKMNGHLIAMRGSESQEDIQDALNAADVLGLELVERRNFNIGESLEYSRSIFVFERVKEANVKLPRRPGMATKRPYR